MSGRTVSVNLVACVLLHRDHRILLLRRDAGDAWPNLWDLPGGRARPEESPAQAASRECLEETGLRPELENVIVDVVAPDILGNKGLFHTVVIAAEAPLDPSVVLSAEHTEARWFRPAEIRSHPRDFVWHVAAAIDAWGVEAERGTR